MGCWCADTGLCGGESSCRVPWHASREASQPPPPCYQETTAAAARGSSQLRFRTPCSPVPSPACRAVRLLRFPTAVFRASESAGRGFLECGVGMEMTMARSTAHVAFTCCLLVLSAGLGEGGTRQPARKPSGDHHGEAFPSLAHPRPGAYWPVSLPAPHHHRARWGMPPAHSDPCTYSKTVHTRQASREQVMHVWS